MHRSNKLWIRLWVVMGLFTFFQWAFQDECLGQDQAELAESLSKVIHTLENTIVRGRFSAGAIQDGRPNSVQTGFEITSVDGQFRCDSKVDLNRSLLPGLYDRVVTVSDGHELYITRFSNRIKPYGCETKISHDDGRGGLISRTSGTLFLHPARYVEFAFNPQSYSAESLNFVAGDAGLLQADIPEAPGVIRTVVIDPQKDWLPVKVEVQRHGKKLEEVLLSWEGSGVDWYLKEIVDISHQSGQKRLLEIDEFESVDEAKAGGFSLASSELCAGSRVLDSRDPSKVDVKFVPQSGRKIATFSELLDAPDGQGSFEQSDMSTARWVLIAGNFVFLVIIAMLIYRRMKMGSASKP